MIGTKMGGIPAGWKMAGGLAVPASAIYGLEPGQVLYGDPDGHIGQDTGLLYDGTYFRTPTVWRDLVGGLNAARVTGATQPSWEAFRGGVYAYAFSGTALNEAWLSFHIQHNIIPGSLCRPHVHFTSKGTALGNYRLSLELSYITTNGAVYPVGTTTSHVIHASPGVDRTDMVASFATLTVPDIGTTIMARLYRDATDPSDTCTGDVFVLSCDIHVQVDRLGTLTYTPPWEP